MEESQGRNYPLFFLPVSKSAQQTLLVTVLGMGVALGLNMAYTRFSSDASPDSIAGYTDAVVGTIFMLLAAIKFSLYRRSRRRALGQLNNSLNWHMCFGILGLFILFLHAFGNFNPRTGTYALYGMIALVISGIIGKIFDRIMPRMIAKQVRQAVTVQGEDKIESISQQLQEIAVHNTQELRGFSPRDSSIAGIPFQLSQSDKSVAANAKTSSGKGSVIQGTWDLAYFSLDETPQELNQQATQYRFVPDRKSELALPSTYLPGTAEHLAAIQKVQNALQLEQCYRYIIRYWRIFHILLAITTISLTVWHLEYAATLLIPEFLHH
ncbi:MAG TPA: hypothetical protein VGN34_06000 [Ktedonobacteraceae bacterium]|jgi:uncharacterized membrane protein YdcZ (DUF606 family)